MYGRPLKRNHILTDVAGIITGLLILIAVILALITGDFDSFSLRAPILVALTTVVFGWRWLTDRRIGKMILANLATMGLYPTQPPVFTLAGFQLWCQVQQITEHQVKASGE